MEGAFLFSSFFARSEVRRDGGANDRKGSKGPTFPAVRRHEAHLSRGPSKEAVAIQGGKLAAASAGVDRPGGVLQCRWNAIATE